MPSISPPSKVLVTGASGYIATWVMRLLLERGFAVRGTVRSADKGSYLKHLFKEHGDRFEWIIVKEISTNGAFDKAVKGVDAVIHTASPVTCDVNEPKEIIDPAVKGTTGILNSILKYGSSIKRVIVLSSCAAVSTPGSDKIFKETDWDENSIGKVETHGAAAPNMLKYRASKVLAEKAAWKVYEDNKGKVSWDLTVLNPPFVYGPVIHQVPTPSSLNYTSSQFYKILFAPGTFSNEALITQGSSFVDVRDVAEAHVRALEREEAGGERIIIAGGWYVWQNFLDSASAEVPPSVRAKLVKGLPGKGRTAKPPVRYNTEKAARILGLGADRKWRTEAMMVKDTVSDFVKRGWILA